MAPAELGGFELLLRGGRGYRQKQAQIKADQRWKGAAKAAKMAPQLRSYIAKKIRLDWSPEQVTGRLRREGLTSCQP